MIEALIRSAIQYRVIVLVLSLLLVLFGIYSVRETPVDAIPDLSDVQVIIKTSYAGQAPQVVEDQVTYPLTTAMLSVPGATSVRGYSFFGDSYVYVIFDDDTDLYWARSRVLEYLSQVTGRLPANAKPELGPDATGVGWIYGYALVDRTGQYDLSQLRSLQDWFLKFELQTVAGVSEVATVGGMVKQYQVIVDPERLQAYSIPLSHLQTAIERANQAVGASVVELAEAEYMVTVAGYLDSVEALNTVPLGVNAKGTPLLLKDVANVVIGPQMRRGVAELNGQGETVGGVVVMRFGENAQRVIERVRKKLEVLKSGLPPGVEIIPFYDRSGLIERAIENLSNKLMQELIAVTLICIVFLLHVKSALVAIISLPIGVLAAFIAMYLLDINANIMSLGGIAVAVGAMVDGAIVMIENLHKHLEKVEGELSQEVRWRAATAAAIEVGPSLFFSLLIITVSFLPVFALQAQEGRLFTPLVYTKSFAMAGAAILAVTLVPVLMGYLVNTKPRTNNPVDKWLVSIYRPVLAVVLKFPERTVLVGIALLLSALYPLSKLGSEFMPPLDEGDLMYMPTTYAGISIGKAREILQQTDKLIATVPEVKTVFGKVGRAETATDPAPLTMIETFIQLKPRSEWRQGVTIEDLTRELDRLVKFPGLSNAWVMPIKTRIDMLATGIKTPVGVKVAGPDLDVIEQIGISLESVLRDVPGTASVYSERVAGGRYIDINIDRTEAARFGLNIADVQQVIATAVGGMNVATTVEGLERYPVNIRYPREYRDTPEQLAMLPIVAPGGQRLALGDVATIRIETGPAGIKSENARLNGWTFVDIAAVDVGQYVEQAQSVVAEKVQLPAGYSITWSGQFEYMQRAEERLQLIIPVTLILIGLLLYVNFQRGRDVLLVLGTLPLALTGGIWLLFFLDFNLSVAVAVGFIALAGVAVELGVLMVLYLNLAIADQGKSDSVLEAIQNGAVRRLRPIMMTTIATIVGLLPIMVGSGTGSEVMQRMAAPMVGGMVSALILVLVMLPAVYLLMHRREGAAKTSFDGD